MKNLLVTISLLFIVSVAYGQSHNHVSDAAFRDTQTEWMLYDSSGNMIERTRNTDKSKEFAGRLDVDGRLIANENAEVTGTLSVGGHTTVQSASATAISTTGDIVAEELRASTLIVGGGSAQSGYEQTINGDIYASGNVGIVGTMYSSYVGIGTTSPDAELEVSANSVDFNIEEADAATNEKKWNFFADAGDLYFRTMADDGTPGQNCIEFIRGTGLVYDQTIIFANGVATLYVRSTSPQVYSPAGIVHQADGFYLNCAALDAEGNLRKKVYDPTDGHLLSKDEILSSTYTEENCPWEWDVEYFRAKLGAQEFTAETRIVEVTAIIPAQKITSAEAYESIKMVRETMDILRIEPIWIDAEGVPRRSTKVVYATKTVIEKRKKVGIQFDEKTGEYFYPAHIVVSGTREIIIKTAEQKKQERIALFDKIEAPRLRGRHYSPVAENVRPEWQVPGDGGVVIGINATQMLMDLLAEQQELEEQNSDLKTQLAGVLMRLDKLEKKYGFVNK